MKYKFALLAITMLTLAALSNSMHLMATPGVETFKCHTWDISKISLSISVSSGVSEVENDLNALANFFESIVGAFVGSDYYVFVGNTTDDPYLGEIIWASGFLVLQKSISVSKDFFLTVANINKWENGEEIPMNETLAEILAFSIPKKSVFVLPPISPVMMMFMGTGNGINSVENVLVPSINIQGINSGLQIIRELLHSIMGVSLRDMEIVGMSATIPIPLDYFVVGTILGKPSAIKAFGQVWEDLNQEYGENFTFKYVESDTEATFSVSGSVSQLGMSISISFSAKYSLTTGLLLDMSLSASLSNFQESIDTHKYGKVPITVSGSINFAMKYTDSEDLEPWAEFGEPLAYKTTELSLSPDLEDLLREAGLFEDVIGIPKEEDVLFYDDVESGNIGWTATGGWHIDSDAYSGSYAWYTGPYTNNASWWLISPPINVSGYEQINISFAIKYSLEEGFDYGFIMISWDNGTTWDTIDAFTGYSYYWIEESYELEVMGDSLRIAFVLVSDEIITDDGIWVDDIKVCSYEVEYISYVDLLRNLRATFVYIDNPTGLDPLYEGTVYYYNETSGAMMEIGSFMAISNMLLPGSIRVYPYKDILYGQMQLEAHIITNIMPKIIKYQLAVERSMGYKVPKFDMSGSYGILESTQNHFAMLANVSFSIEYTDVEPGDTPFIASGHGGIWYVYKSTGYLVEAGVEFSLQLKYDTDGDGSLDDETTKEYATRIIVNKVVSEPLKASSGWTINWNKLDSDPPPFTETQAWSDVTPSKAAGGMGAIPEPVTIGATVIILVLIVAVILAMRRRKP